MLSDSSSDESDQPKLKINQKFARQYEDQKRFQDLQRNQELLGNVGDLSGSESESSSEDEDAIGLTTGLDVEIMKTISSIKKRDPKIYEKSTKFYTQSNDNSSDDSSDNEDGKKTKKSKKSKKSEKKTYKDVVREQLLSGKVDSGSDNEDGKDTYYDKEKALAYDQEQEKIRQKFLSSAMSGDDSSGDDDEMMTLKPKSASELADEEARLQDAIEEVANLNKMDAHLDPKDEDFLSTYMMQKKWMDDADLKVDKKTTDFMSKESEDELLDLEEDEEELYEVDKFESKYNFRFEEEQQQQQGQEGNVIGGGGGMGEVMGHARNTEGSLRRVDDKRKKQREERRERKEKERRVKEAELRRLKNLKREEVRGEGGRAEGLSELAIEVMRD
jgi:protein KRI1